MENSSADMPDKLSEEFLYYSFSISNTIDHNHAAERAINLRKKHRGDGNPVHYNPSSSVDLLVAHLKRLSTRNKKS